MCFESSVEGSSVFLQDRASLTHELLHVQIRDAAGDALTGLIPPSQVSAKCESILNGIQRDLSSINKNEVNHISQSCDL